MSQRRSRSTSSTSSDDSDVPPSGTERKRVQMKIKCRSPAKKLPTTNSLNMSNRRRTTGEGETEDRQRRRERPMWSPPHGDGLQRKNCIIKQLATVIRVFAEQADRCFDGGKYQESDISLLNGPSRWGVNRMVANQRRRVLNYRALNERYDKLEREHNKLRAEGKTKEKRKEEEESNENDRLTIRCSELVIQLAKSEAKVATSAMTALNHEVQLDKALKEIPHAFVTEVNTEMERLLDERTKMKAKLDELESASGEVSHNVTSRRAARLSDDMEIDQLSVGSPAGVTASKRHSSSPGPTRDQKRARSDAPLPCPPLRPLGNNVTSDGHANIEGSAVRVKKYGTTFKDWPKGALEVELTYAMSMWSKKSAEHSRLKKMAEEKEELYAKERGAMDRQLTETEARLNRMNVNLAAINSKCQCDDHLRTISSLHDDVTLLTNTRDQSLNEIKTKQKIILTLRRANALLVGGVAKLKVQLDSLKKAHQAEGQVIRGCIAECTASTSTQIEGLVVHVQQHELRQFHQRHLNVSTTSTNTEEEPPLAPPSPSPCVECVIRAAALTKVQLQLGRATAAKKKLKERLKESEDDISSKEVVLKRLTSDMGEMNKENEHLKERVDDLSSNASSTAPVEEKAPFTIVEDLNVKPAPSISSCSTEDAKTAVQLNAVRRSFKDGLTRISGHLRLEPYTVGEGGQYALREHKEHVMAGVKQLAVKLEVGGWTTFTK